MALPKTRIRSYYERRTEADENDTRSKAPITITPNDNVALPESRIKSYYERSTEADENDIRLKTPITATPNDRIVMIVHAPDHDPISKANMFQEGMFDWSGKGNHVDYLPDETVELEQGELLGYGANSSIYRTICKGIAVAWKRIYCQAPINLAQKKEIEMLKRLDHRHIMRLVGTYTSKRFLGVLLWPVAVCDLGALMEDLDHFLDQETLTLELDLQDKERGARLDAIMGHGMTTSVQRSAILPLLQRRLLRCFGCLASALAYLHAQGIRHNNLKPSNVLLTFNGLWLTDFDTSTDFSENICTATNSDDRDTSKYLAPEMAQFEPSGKAADIFSLGAMYLEMIALCDHKRLDFMRKLRPDRDHSFQANLSHSQSWLDAISPTTQETDSDLLKLISEMLAFDPTKRPDTVEVNARLSVYTSDLEQHLQAGTYSLRYYDTCCRHVYLGHREQFYIDAQWTRHQAPAKSDWLIRKADKKAFDTLFNKIDTKRTGSISKVQVLASFSIWGLSDETLLKIWKLAAIRYGDWLGRDEFAVAMFLIRSQCGSLKHLPTRIPHKLIPPSLRPILHLKEDSPRGYLYNCPKADCPFQLEKGLTGPEQLKQHLSIFHLEIAPRRLSGIFRDLGRLSPKQEVTDTRPSRLGDSKARMKEATTSELEVLPGTRLSLLEQSKSRMRGATFSEMEILPEIFEEVRLV